MDRRLMSVYAVRARHRGLRGGLVAQKIRSWQRDQEIRRKKRVADDTKGAIFTGISVAAAILGTVVCILSLMGA
jgi:hypothetical protein